MTDSIDANYDDGEGNDNDSDDFDDDGNDDSNLGQMEQNGQWRDKQVNFLAELQNITQKLAPTLNQTN